MRMRRAIIGLLAATVATSGGAALATTSTGGGLKTGNVSLKVLARPRMKWSRALT